MASVVFEHVFKRYADGVEAVTDMNLAIEDGEFVILVGPSGSGKSTALRMVAGLEDITEGVIRIGDDIVNDLAPRERDIRRRLEAGDGGGRRDVLVGIRPEHIEDAMLVTLPATGHLFKTRIDVLEALGSDSYAHFTVDSPRVASSELEALADETSAPSSAEGVQVVARLAAASAIKQGQEAQLWVDTSRLHIFDHETGRSLLTRESSRLEVPEPRQPPAAAA